MRRIKVILAMVVSVNGKSTKGLDSPRFWASKEDQEHFYSLIARHNLIVMGRKTYESAKSGMQLEGKRRIVITSNPKKFRKEQKEGVLEFTSESPGKLLSRLQKEGSYKSLLLLGGATINGLFFKEKLVDELWLTLEPMLFTRGKGLVEGTFKDSSLQLKKIKKLNKKGTLLLQYKVL